MPISYLIVHCCAVPRFISILWCVTCVCFSVSNLIFYFFHLLLWGCHLVLESPCFRASISLSCKYAWVIYLSLLSCSRVQIYPWRCHGLIIVIYCLATHNSSLNLIAFVLVSDAIAQSLVDIAFDVHCLRGVDIY